MKTPAPGATPQVARSADTAAEAEQVQIDLLRAAPVAARLRLAVSLSETVIGAARRALERSSPHLSKRDLDVKFVALHYRGELAAGLEQELTRRDRKPGPGA